MDDISTQFRALLEEEHAALIAGNLNNLAQFISEKDRLAKAIQPENGAKLSPELQDMCQ